MALSQSEIYSLAKGAGLNDSRAKVAAAIAMAESGGNPNAHNSTPPDDSYGLWQINMIGAMGPARRKSFGIKNNSDLYNAATNTSAMAKISNKGGNFSAWSTYTNGAYLKYKNNEVKDLSLDEKFIRNVKQSFGEFLGKLPGGDTVKDVSGAVSGTADAASKGIGYVEKSASWLSNSENWVRIAYVLGGSVIVIVGINALIQSTSAGRAVTGTVKGATAIATKGVVK